MTFAYLIVDCVDKVLISSPCPIIHNLTTKIHYHYWTSPFLLSICHM